MAPAPFTDLTITGIDNEKTLASNNGRDAMYWVHFQLSERPPPEWVTILEREAKSRFHSMKRETKCANHVSKHFVTVHCPIAEVERHQKQEVIDLVASTNKLFREHAQKVSEKSEREAKARQDAHNKAAEELKKIKF